MTFDGNEIIVEMNDNPTSEDFISMLPLNLKIKDYNGTEKITYTLGKISVKDVPNGYEPKAGDFILFAPWGNIVVFYHDFCYADGLVIIIIVLLAIGS